MSVLLKILVFFSVSLGVAHSQESYPGKLLNHSCMPDGWQRNGYPSYIIRADSVDKHSGKYSILIEAPDAADADMHGYAYYTIPQKYAGDRVTLKALVKAEGNTQPIGLMLSLLNSEGVTTTVKSTQHDGVMGTSEWKEYSLSLQLTDMVACIVVGARLTGPGKMWIDDFEILIDDKELSSAKLLFEWDVEFVNGSKIHIAEYTPQMLDNLEVLCLVWGFLKYYHPAITDGDYNRNTDGNYNWDAELFRIMPTVLTATNIYEVTGILSQWIDSFGAIDTSDKNYEPPEHLIYLYPDLRWLNTEKLGIELTEKLLKIRDAKRTANYYAANHFKNETKYHAEPGNDTGLRLLALFRYWNIVQYFYPYKYLIDKDWNSILVDFIPKFLDASNEKDYRMTVAKLVTHICSFDRHYRTTVFINNREFITTYQLSYIEGKVVVTDYYRNYTILKTGDIIEKIDGQSVEELIRERLVYTPGANEPAKIDEILNNTLFRLNSNNYLELDIIRNGIAEKYTLTNTTSQPLEKEAHKLLTPDIGYVYMASVRGLSANMINALQDTKGMVIDMRSNQKISYFYDFVSFLLPHQTEIWKSTFSNRNLPGMFTINFHRGGRSRNDYYKGKVVIIVNEKTVSGGELMTMALQQATNVIVIGSATAGDNGFETYIPLPGDISTAMPYIGVYYPDGRQVHRAGIAIDEEIRPTLRGITDGRDELLERAIERVKNEE